MTSLPLWKSGVLAAAAMAVAGVGPALHAQVRADRAPRGFEMYSGRGGEIGVSIREVEQDTTRAANRAGPGVVIEEVTGDSPAEKAGIKTGDVLIEFDGERVRSVRQFTRLIQETPPGRKVAAVLTRSGQRVNVTLEPRAGSSIRLLGDLDGARLMADFGREFANAFPPPLPPPPPAAPGVPNPPDAPPFPPAPPDIQSFFWRPDATFGLSVLPLSSQLADYFGAKRGVLVTAVKENSVAQAAGFRAGDVVTALNGADVTEPADLRRHTEQIHSGAEFTAEVLREKKAVTLKGKMERRATRGATRVAL
jgi:serine protease Do